MHAFPGCGCGLKAPMRETTMEIFDSVSSFCESTTDSNPRVRPRITHIYIPTTPRHHALHLTVEEYDAGGARRDIVLWWGRPKLPATLEQLHGRPCLCAGEAWRVIPGGVGGHADHCLWGLPDAAVDARGAQRRCGGLCALQRSSLTTKINFKSFMIIYSCIHSFHSIEAKITNQLIHLIDAERLNNTT